MQINISKCVCQPHRKCKEEIVNSTLLFRLKTVQCTY